METDILKQRKNLRILVEEALADGMDTVVLVGSFARGANVRTISDIDVLCVGELYPQSRPPDTHVISLSKNELAVRVRRGDDFPQWALRYGVPIYGRKHWEQLKRDLLDTAPWPSYTMKLDQAKRCAARFEEILDLGDLEAATEYARLALSQMGRGALFSRDVFPLSRPEIVGQLMQIDESELSEWLQKSISSTKLPRVQLRSILRLLKRRLHNFQSPASTAPADN